MPTKHQTQRSLKLADRGVAIPTTVTVREAFARMLECNASKFGTWLTQVAEGHTFRVKRKGKFEDVYVAPNPGQALELVIKIAEYHIPKLQRTELTGQDGGPIVVQATPLDEKL